MIDNRENAWLPTAEEVAELCDRHFGIGADGLILIEGDEETEFYMNYYNLRRIAIFLWKWKPLCGGLRKEFGYVGK